MKFLMCVNIMVEQNKYKCYHNNIYNVDIISRFATQEKLHASCKTQLSHQ